MKCDICDTQMLHYEAGEEWRCPNRANHDRIISRHKQGDHRNRKTEGGQSFDSETGRAAAKKRWKKE